MPIEYINRQSGKSEQEKVLGDFWIKSAYHPLFQWFTDQVLSRAWISSFVGMLQNSQGSRGRIPHFVREYGIRLEDFEERDYRSFNEFFIRKFKPGVRPFDTGTGIFANFAESRMFALEGISGETEFRVKDAQIDLAELLRDAPLARSFSGGTLLLARLCPVDYHRFHYPCDSVVLEQRTIHGKLHSVNPDALKARPRLFLENERHITLLQSPSFGRYALIEVGALCVGKIVQTGPLEGPVLKGQEKGYFLFGGSTVIALIPEGRLICDRDLITNTRAGVETWVPLGDRLGEAKHP